MKNIDWGKWSAIAEVFGAFAIVISLVFVIVEIRGNTTTIRATTYERNIQTIIDMRMVDAQDPEVSRLFAEARQGGYTGMDPVDKGRVRAWVGALFMAYEKAYFSENYGLLGRESARFDRNACGILITLEQEPELREYILSTALTEEYSAHLLSMEACTAISL